MKKVVYRCLRRFWILFRRRLRHYRRLLGKNRRKVEAWFGRRVAAPLRAFEYYGARFFKKIWSELRSFPILVSLLLLAAVGVLGGSFVPDLFCWFGGLWNSEDLDGVYYLRSPLITAGAALLAASVAACFFAWRNWIAGKQLKNTNKQLAYTNEQLKNAQTSLQEERYKKGVELLGHASQVVRIGGLYALHQLAEDFPKTWALPVMELMCIFVRTPPLDKDKPEETPDQDKAERSGKKSLRRDVQEAVKLLGIRNLARREEEKGEPDKAKKKRRGKSPGGGGLDFGGADLAGGIWIDVDLEGAHFFRAKLGEVRFLKSTLTDANFSEATLEGASFLDTELEGAHFRETKIGGARFSSTKLTKVHFLRAQLGGARFFGSKLEGARFFGSKLEGARFFHTKLEGVSFREATLTEATFYDATLTDANFEGADITGTSLIDANLSGVILLVQRTFMKEDKSNRVFVGRKENESNPIKGLTRGQLELGWFEPGRPPLKIVEDKDKLGLTMRRTTMTLTEADWKEELGLDSPPALWIQERLASGG